MENIKPLTFSIISASRNEAHDIRETIESMLKQTYLHKEIIFIDDSSDNTKDIIREYAKQGIRLFDGPRKGCCAARNIGIQNATGDVIVFVNADARLSSDFLEKIAKHYKQGAEWVLVKSHVMNIDNLYARFVQSEANIYENSTLYDPYTSEGYSCRKEVALRVGMITTVNAPLNFCTDWTLGKKLTRAKVKKVFDRTIKAYHKAPDNLKEYWQVRKTRGWLAAVVPHFLLNHLLSILFVKFLVKDIIEFILWITVIPTIIRVIRIARESPYSRQDIFLFFWPYSIHILSRICGEWQGWFQILRMRGMLSSRPESVTI